MSFSYQEVTKNKSKASGGGVYIAYYILSLSLFSDQ